MLEPPGGEPDERGRTGSAQTVTRPTAAAVGDPEPVDSPPWRFRPILAMLGTGLALLAVFAYGRYRSPIPFGYFSHPPIYGIWAPTWDRAALTVLPAAALLAATAWVVTSSRRVPTWLALAALIGCGVLTAIAVGLVRGDPHDLIRGVSTARTSPYYTSDLYLLDRLGVREFIERHPELTTRLHSYNSRTHPPGPLVFLFGLFKVFGAGHPLRIATALAVLALAAAVAAWAIGRSLGGERAGRIAAVLFVAAPGPLMLAYACLDMTFALLISTSIALFMLAIHRRSAPIAAAAGAVLGLGTLLTFATVFVVLAATLAVLVQSRSLRASARLLVAALAGGALVLVLARVLAGFDILASYHSSPGAGRRYDPYWIIGSPTAWLIFAGLPLAALGVVGLVRAVPGARRPVLPLILVLLMVVWAALPSEFTKLRPGEVERTWAFLYPLLAASAGVVVDRWTRRPGHRAGAIVAGLVLLSVAQAVLIQGLWDNLN